MTMDEDEVNSLSDTEKSKSHVASESCLLCGSCDKCLYEMESANRVKWTLHFCQLFRIDDCPTVAQTTKAEMWTTMQSALYCSDCMDSLERISHLLQTIEDINAQLRVIQLQCEAKLRAAKQNLHDPHEVKRRRSLWACMRVGEATLSGPKRDLRVTGIELHSTSAPIANDKDDLVRKVSEETEPSSNPPSSLFSLADTDSDSTLDSVKQEPLDSSGSGRSPMPSLPIQEFQEQSDVVIKVEPADASSEGLDEVEKTEENACSTRGKRRAEASHSGTRKKSKTLRPKRKDQKLLRARFGSKSASIQNEKRESGVEKSESETERDNSVEAKANESTSSSCFKATSAPQLVCRARRSRPVAYVECGSDSDRKSDKTKERRFTGNSVEVKKRWEWRLACSFAPECKRIFHTKSRRDEHLILVHEGKKFTCEICGKSYGLQKLLDDHGNTHKGLTPFKCAVCPKEFAMSLQLRMHKLNAHSHRPLKCRPCGKAFSTDANYEKHLRSATHLTRSKPKVNSKESAPRVHLPRPKIGSGNHKCPFPNCDKTYTTRGSFRKHLRTHDEATRASLTCKFCQRTYESKSSLKRHEALLHTGEAKFRCEHCPFLAMHKFSLQKHVDTVHSEERPLQCDVCGHTFKHPSYLRQHKQTYHPTTKDYMCSICGKCFSNKRYLQEHDGIHKEVKSFLCTHCGRGFAQKPSLGRHLRTVHKIPATCPGPATKKIAVDASEIAPENAEIDIEQVQVYAGESRLPPEMLSLFNPSFPPF